MRTALAAASVLALSGCSVNLERGPVEHLQKSIDLDKSEMSRVELKMGAGELNYSSDIDLIVLFDPDAPALTRYTAEPLEVSLVDHPCLPEATFALIKADGSTELRKFKTNEGEAIAQSSLLRRPVGAPRDDVAEDLTKFGARHSEADKDRIKQSHDILVELDPDCCPGASLTGTHQFAAAIFSPGGRDRRR